MKAGQRLLGVLGLGLALSPIAGEVALGTRDDWAFPHVNFYEEDPVLGVRLAPGAEQRMSFAGNPVHTLRTNSRGYRGGEWGAPGAEVVVLGDSQVFGLGVEDGQTASALLAQKLGQPVINAGVPTYGPPEFLALLPELLERKPAKVVLVINMANDLFEEGRPNRDRHRVWDGWAVRTETAPAEVMDFPGRGWLMARSHLVFHLRRWNHARQQDPEAADLSLASQGGALDLAQPVEVAGLRQQGEKQGEVKAQARQKVAPIEQAEVQRMKKAAPLAVIRGEAADVELEQLLPTLTGQEDADLMAQGARRGAHAGDIVHELYAESDRHIRVTAEQLALGAELRRDLAGRARRWLRENPRHPEAQTVKWALETWEATQRKIGPASTVAPVPSAPPPLAGLIDQMDAATRAAGAELVVVVLPVDVQVHPSEWAKYGLEPQDLREVDRLADDIVRYAAGKQLRAASALPALRAAEPGAFLKGDIHLSPRGQEVLAEVLADAVQAPVPPPLPGPGLPEGRGRVPVTEEWKAAQLRELTAGGLNCLWGRVRDWGQLECSGRWERAEQVEGSQESLLWLNRSQGGELLWRGPVGEGLKLRLGLQGMVWVLEISNQGDLQVSKPSEGRLPAGVSLHCPSFKVDLHMGADRGCLETWSECEDQIECLEGVSRLRLPECPAGQANAGSAGHCFPLCDEANPCARGRCTPWQGSAVCL